MRRVTVKAFSVALAQTSLILLVVLSVRFLVHSTEMWMFVDQRLHSVIEAISAMAALVNAALLHQAVRYHRRSPSYVWLSGSMLTLGALGLIHATAAPHMNILVWLELMSSLIAGTFALASVGPSRFWISPGYSNLVLGSIVLFSSIIGLVFVFFPSLIPTIVLDGRFTYATSTLGIVSMCFFLIATTRLMSRAQENAQSEDRHLAYYCLFSGVSTLYLPGYHTWGILWWSWHATQFIAHLTVLSMIARWVMRMNVEVVESERRLKMLAEAAYEAAVSAVDGRIIDINRAFTEMTGYEKNEVVGRRLSDFICDEYRKRPNSQIGAIVGDPRKIRKQIVAVRRDHSIAFVEVRQRNIQAAERTFEVALLRDTTDRRTIELGLEELAASCHFLLHQLRGLSSVETTEVLQVARGRSKEVITSFDRGPSAADTAIRQVHRIVRSTDGLLQYSRARGKRTSQKPCSSASAISRALEQLDGELRALSIEVHVGELPVVVGDDALLLGLFRNLIESLVRSLDPRLPREIFIHAERTGDDWKFCLYRESGEEENLSPTGDDPLVHVVCREITARLGGKLTLERDRNGLRRVFFTVPYFQWISVRK